MSKQLLKQKYLFWFIFLLTAFMRLYKLGETPSGLNQDEAYAGYEAFSLLTTGHDSWGYPFPLYFISWGSGMNVLYSYITIPFLAIFGVKTWVLRLPQALLGILSCYVFYRLLRILYNRQTALLGFFLSAIIPWHIMLSRWALEVNIAPFFILTGLYFFARSLKKKEYLLLSALFYGLALYTYATAWIYVVITLGCQLLYLLCYKKDQPTLINTLSSGIIFTILALPIVSLILINQEIIPEIKTAFFSVPKLLFWRQNEIGLEEWTVKLNMLKYIFTTGNDYLPTNAIPFFGIFYPLSLPFILLGLYKMYKTAREDLKKHIFSFSAIIFVSIIFGLIYASVLYPCINRLNYLWFNLLIALTVGIDATRPHKKIFYLILTLYCSLYIAFTHQYFSKYNELASAYFSPNLKQALNAAEQLHRQSNLPITLADHPFNYPKILFYQKISPQDFTQTVSWLPFPNSYLDASSFTHYSFMPETDYSKLATDRIYIAPLKQKYFFYQFDIKSIGDLLVASPK